MKYNTSKLKVLILSLNEMKVLKKGMFSNSYNGMKNRQKKRAANIWGRILN